MTSLMTMEHADGIGIPAAESNYDRRWWILAVLGIAQLMVILDSTIVKHCPPDRAARPALFQRRPPVDRHRLLACLRQLAPPGRANR